MNTLTPFPDFAHVPALIVICGPTAAGKSGLAMAIAQKLQTVIISADSRQIYRNFDIGTAKPSKEDLRTVRHYMIDECVPTEALTLADYQTEVQRLIHDFHQQDGRTRLASLCSVPSVFQKQPDISRSDVEISPTVSATPQIPLLVGGTGLYIKSIVRGLKIPRVPPNAELRSQLEDLGQYQCYRFLQQVDAESAARIHPNDRVRTLRALEVYYTTGIPMTEQQGESPPPYPILQLGVDCFENHEDDALTHRIEQRTRHMIDQGLVEEVAQLCDRYGRDLPLLNTLGYQEIRQHLAGEISLEEAIAQTTLHTRQFAKRQRTWFRADSSIEWLEATDPRLIDHAWERIQEFLRALKISTP